MNSMTSYSYPDQRADISPIWWLYIPLVAVALVVCTVFLPEDWLHTWVRGEHGVLEYAQEIMIAAAGIVALRTLSLPAVKATTWLKVWLWCLGLGALWVTGEEISWGQHMFGWGTPDPLAEVNDQKETNLHNTSHWFFTTPLRILEIAVLIGGIIVPLVALRWRALGRIRLAIVFPALICLPLAVITIISRAVKIVTVHLQGGDFPLPLRGGETEELFLYAFLLLYAVSLRARLRALG